MGMFTPLSSFIGRQSEITSLRQTFDSGARLVTLTGPGGIGKTRLALETTTQVADNFTDGVFFVPLDALTEVGQVLSKIANVISIPQSGSRSIIEDLITSLTEKHILICLDNLEHVLEIAPQLAELLTACPHLYMLATSREALRIRGEHVFQVNPLSFSDPDKQGPPAVQLFVDRAIAINPYFEPDDQNTPAIAKICALLDGMPLAIELAAGLLRMYSPAGLLNHLETTSEMDGNSPLMDLLEGGARDLPVRQQTLRTAIGWSYHLLDPIEQQIFRKLAVFSGGCDLIAAQTVCTTDDISSHQILGILISLTDKNLLRIAKINGEPRFGLLRTIREYAHEVLEANGELRAANQLYVNFYLKSCRTGREGTPWT